MSNKYDGAIDVPKEDIVASAKIGPFTRFKPSMRSKKLTPLEKFQHYVPKVLQTTMGTLIDDGVTIEDIVVHIDDLELLEEYETIWAMKYTYVGESTTRAKASLAFHFLNYSPCGSRSEGIERGHVYIRDKTNKGNKTNE